MNPASPCVTATAAPCSETKLECSLEVPGVPISMMRVGEVGTIVSISGREDVRRFLTELGFTPGTVVKAVSQASGNIIIEVKDSKIAIDRHMANKILFSPGR